MSLTQKLEPLTPNLFYQENVHVDVLNYMHSKYHISKHPLDMRGIHFEF